MKQELSHRQETAKREEKIRPPAKTLRSIPLVGWITALITLATAGLTHSHWIWMAALLGLWRMVMHYGIAARVMGHELEFHPLLAVFTVMIGGAVGGIVGIYLSVPLVAALRVIWHRFSLLKGEKAGGTPRAMGPFGVASD